jgi:multidrug efflux pump subunit AcrB
MNIYLIIAVLLLSIAIVVIAIAFLIYIKKSTFIPDKDKEFIDFTIDMYIQYAKDLNIHSPRQHKKIVEQLQKIKDKYLKQNEQRNRNNTGFLSRAKFFISRWF